MIDETFDTEFEARLRATLDEMIPKLVASEIAHGEQGSQATVDVLTARRATPASGSRRLAVAALAVAATVLGLFIIVGRDRGDVVPGDNSASSVGPPAWYDLIAPSLPERFQSVALTHATDEQLFFVAINPVDGKTLEIQLASGGYTADPTTTVDATGEWVETAHGWSVRTPAGLFVSVTCDIGVGGRDYVGPENYCDLTEGITSFTKDEVRAVAKALATSLTVSIFGQDLGSPSSDTIDTAEATALIEAAVPGQPISDTDMGKGADHIYDVGAGVGSLSSSDTIPPLDASLPPSGISVRILHGVLPAATVNGEPVINGYQDAAVVSMFGSGGVYVRISITDARPGPESVIRLAELARDLISADPTAAQAGSAPTIVAALPTTTTSELPSAATTPAGNTTTTLEACPETNSATLAVVVNASHVDDMGIWWTGLLAASVPTVHFADPLKVVAQSPVSRVLALDGFECNASVVAHLTTGADVEPATRETLQALLAEPVPAGTSIVVIIGNDSLSTAATGATTTSSSAAP